MQLRIPGEEELAKLYRLTLYERWGIEGAPGGGGIGSKGLDSTCMCDRCLEIRRDRWTREQPS